MFVEAATEPFVLLLAVAGALAVIVGEGRDGLLVLVGLMPIVGADVVTEYRGQRALEALREASAPMTRARRDGQVEDLLAMALVPGDIVLLRGGDVVPADLRIARAEGLLIDRSMLTGESLPEPGTVAPDARGRDPQRAPCDRLCGHQRRRRPRRGHRRRHRCGQRGRRHRQGPRGRRAPPLPAPA